MSYWEETYSKLSGDSDIVTQPSTFAIDISHRISQDDTILEIGCGNGRDAAFFSAKVSTYVGIDACPAAIARSKEGCSDQHVKFMEGRMPEDISSAKIGINPSVVYSRFTLHSLSDEDIVKTVTAVREIIQPGGSFFIEARSTRDPRHGVGEQVGPRAWIDTHFRNFLDVSDFRQLLENAQFHIVSICEEFQRARFKSDHAVVVRVHAIKKNK